MANRFEFKLPHEFIVIDCNCGQKYVLFTVYSDDELEERRNSRYCPYCGMKHQAVIDAEEKYRRGLEAWKERDAKRAS